MDFSKLGTLKLSDFWRGLIVAVLTSVLTVIYEAIGAGGLAINWKLVISSGVTAGIAYILKNLGTGSAGNLLTNSDKPIASQLLETKKEDVK